MLGRDFEVRLRAASSPNRTKILLPMTMGSRQLLTLYTMVVYLLGGVMGDSDEVAEFDWNGGNAMKNWLRHKVTQAESEQVFFNRPLVVADDNLHSETELRHFALGQTDAGRLLFVVYTLRNEGEKVRIISARDMTGRERKEYEHARAQEADA
jgi:uncharacterized DUF497 family protein